MKRILLFVCIQFFLLASFAGETINFCKSWKFHLGDAGKGASSSSYNDSQWRILNIPHDWSIEGTYKQFENGTDWQSGFLPAGISWYRKTFTIPSKWKNKKVDDFELVIDMGENSFFMLPYTFWKNKHVFLEYQSTCT